MSARSSGIVLVLLAVALAGGGCSTRDVAERPDTALPPGPSTGDDVMTESTLTMSLRSLAFESGAEIPRRHTGDGEDVSPPLTWSDPPQGTRSFALICDDPDAPSAEPWVHWVMFNLPGALRDLPEGVPSDGRPAIPAGSVQGTNSWGRGSLGYRGPAPPRGHGVHHYRFRLFALDAALTLPPGVEAGELLRAIDGHVLTMTELVGTYER